MTIKTYQLNEQLADLYLEYVNNFITYGKFAAYYGLPQDSIESILKAGKLCHEFRVELNAE
jgi:hypothetical protein